LKKQDQIFYIDQLKKYQRLNKKSKGVDIVEIIM